MNGFCGKKLCRVRGKMGRAKGMAWAECCGRCGRRRGRGKCALAGAVRGGAKASKNTLCVTICIEIAIRYTKCARILDRKGARIGVVGVSVPRVGIGGNGGIGSNAGALRRSSEGEVRRRGTSEQHSGAQGKCDGDRGRGGLPRVQNAPPSQQMHSAHRVAGRKDGLGHCLPEDTWAIVRDQIGNLPSGLRNDAKKLRAHYEERLR